MFFPAEPVSRGLCDDLLIITYRTVLCCTTLKKENSLPPDPGSITSQYAPGRTIIDLEINFQRQPGLRVWRVHDIENWPRYIITSIVYFAIFKDRYYFGRLHFFSDRSSWKEMCKRDLMVGINCLLCMMILCCHAHYNFCRNQVIHHGFNFFMRYLSYEHCGVLLRLINTSSRQE